MNSNKNTILSKILKLIYKEEYVPEMEEKITKVKEKHNKKKEERYLSSSEIVLGIIWVIIIVFLVVGQS